MSLGLGIMGAGFLTLVGILIELIHKSANSWQVLIADSQVLSRVPTAPPRPCRRGSASRINRRFTSVTRTVTESDRFKPIGISTNVAGLYRGNTVATPSASPAGAHPGTRRMPTELVIYRDKQGMSELEIADDLGLGRDEVSLILNLNRLSRGKMQ